jgi:predicted nucleic-acid-binding protein
VIGLDTNMIVRMVVRDDERQTAVADRVFDSLTPRDKGYLTQIVQVELWWVLRRRYRLPAAEVSKLMAELLASDNLEFEKPQDLAWALELTNQGADLADLLIARQASRRGGHTLTLDEKSAALGFGMELAD